MTTKNKLFKHKKNGLVYRVAGYGESLIYLPSYSDEELTESYNKGEWGDYTILKNEETGDKIKQMAQSFNENFEAVK